MTAHESAVVNGAVHPVADLAEAGVLVFAEPTKGNTVSEPAAIAAETSTPPDELQETATKMAENMAETEYIAEAIASDTVAVTETEDGIANSEHIEEKSTVLSESIEEAQVAEPDNSAKLQEIETPSEAAKESANGIAENLTTESNEEVRVGDPGGILKVQEPEASNATAEASISNIAGSFTTPENQSRIPVQNVHKKPLLLLTAPPVTGHTTPLLRLATQMVARGFEVIFMSTLEFKKAIEKTGAEFYESVTPFADIAYLKSRHTLPPGLPTLMADMENMFIKQMAPRSLELKSALELVRERDPARSVVVVTETMSLAPMPFIYGAPLPRGYDKFPRTININTVPIMLLSIDTGITGSGLPPDSSESGRARNKFMNQMVVRGPFGGTDRVFHQALKDLGCTSVPRVFFQNAWLESYDTTFQMCVPSLEYPRSDLHLSIRFSGALAKTELDPNFPYPPWWDEIKTNALMPPAERKKVVAVAQGTVALNYADLLIPTVEGLSKRSDVIVVALLGVKGASLPSELIIFDNARVIDFLPYDAILEYADIFVTNGGYGGVAHGVLNGVPMILAGTSEDKAEVCARGAHAGFAINLNVHRPTSQQIAEASEKIFSDPTFKHRALRLQQENEDLDAVSIVERQILKYGKSM